MINETKEQWGPKLKDVRKELKLNQDDFGKILQVDQGTVARWEKGESSPKAQFKKKMQNFLEMMDNQTMKEVVKKTMHSEGGVYATAAVTGLMFGLFAAYKAGFKHVWPIVLQNPDLMIGINKLSEIIKEGGRK